MITLEVLRTGPLALVQDLGRPGLAHIGVTHSGAADRRSHSLANRLVANPARCATVEITLGGFCARVHGGPLWLTVTGADAEPAVDGIPFGLNSIHCVGPGQVISMGAPAAGLRSYLGLRGGVDVPAVLGSRSHDTLSGIGPAPLHAGDTVPVGRPADGFPELDQAPVATIGAEPVDLPVLPGPRDEWFTNPDTLVDTHWVISERSDRVGIRLAGPPLRMRWPQRQLPSEGTIRGAIQVPPDGRPVILGPDHPVTGGYPVIGVLADSGTDTLAQARPGQRLRLYWGRPRTAAAEPSGW